MTGRRRLGLVAASATLLAAAPLSAIFATWTWLIQCILAVGMVAGAAVPITFSSRVHVSPPLSERNSPEPTPP